MALPSRDKTFALENCRDLLDKLEREHDRFARAETPSDRIDHAFNFVVTAWQLCDWVFEDITQAQRDKLRIHSLLDMQKYAREKCRALHLCQQVATASKHFEIKKYPDPNLEVRVTASPIVDEKSPAFPLAIASDWHLYFEDGDRRLEAETVFGLALDFWTQFIMDLRGNRSALALQQSHD